MIEALVRMMNKDVSVMFFGSPSWFGPYKVVDVIIDDVEYAAGAGLVLQGTHRYTMNVDQIIVVREEIEDDPREGFPLGKTL